MPTRSFAEIYERHEGPFLVSATLPGDNGGVSAEKFDKRMGAWEAHHTALMLLRAHSAVLGVVVWDVYEQQFVCSYRQGDQDRDVPGPPDPIIEAERVDAEKRARSLTRSLASADDVPLEQREGVLMLRAAGMGYVAIEKEFGIVGKKGFWAWKIVKAAEQNAGKKTLTGV